MGVLKWIAKRAKEPSTAGGLVSVISGVAVLAGRPEIGETANTVLPIILSILGGVLIGTPKPEDDLLGAVIGGAKRG